MHGNICKTHQVHDVTDLKQCPRNVWYGLGQNVIDDTMDEQHERLWACIHAKGRHFEHSVWFKSTPMLML